MHCYVMFALGHMREEEITIFKILGITSVLVIFVENGVGIKNFLKKS